MSWNALPNELRRQVWSFMTYEGKNLDDGGEISCEWRRNRADLANCALVNRQWQGIFEEAMFKNIFLTQETVQSLRKITQRQKKLVRYIWLKIAIDSLPCRSCPDYDLACGTVSSLDHVAAGLCMLRFLFILSSWKRDELGCPEGLTIELSCFSPEDAQHSFRNDLFFDSSPFADEIQLGGNRVPLNYVEHGTINGRRAAPLDTNNIIKLFHDDIDLPSPDHCDPATGVVDVVSRLVIRRQTRRHLDPFLMQRIIEALPELTEVTYEPWRDWRESDQDSKFFELIDGLPSGVQNLKIFEDFNEEYNLILAGASIYDDDSTSQIELSRTHGPELSTALAMRSQSLRNLSASYMIDAVDFFNHAAADETMRWENLESLCLSSVTLGLLDVSIDSEVNETLYLAGKVALRMPRLKKLDVWYAQRGIVFGFAYRSDGNDVTIQWKGTDSLQFGDKVISRWSQVAAARSGGRKTLTVLPEELIDGRLINSHATAIKVLGIGEDVLHPVSLKQIDHETERYFFGLQPTEEFEKVTAEQKAGDDDYWPGYRYAGSDGWGPIYVLDEA